MSRNLKPFAKFIGLIICTFCFVSMTLDKGKNKLYKHAVTITFKAGTPKNEITAVDNSFKNLTKLKVVKGYEWGIIDDKKQIKHIYILSFFDKKDLATYAQSPEHQAHIKIGAAYTESVSAIQYFEK